MSNRKQLSDTDFNLAVKDIQREVAFRANQKGPGSFASTHEALGIIQEEYHELVEAIHEPGDHDQVVHELTDIAVACVFAIASINAGGVDW